MREDLSRFRCQNAARPNHGEPGIGNLTVRGPYGKDRPHRLLDGRTCKARSSERKGTPLFGSQPPRDKAVSLWRHLAERNGVRATPRLVGVAPDTVVRYRRLAGNPAQRLHDERMAFSPGDPPGPVRREVVVRPQEAGALRSR